MPFADHAGPGPKPTPSDSRSPGTGSAIWIGLTAGVLFLVGGLLTSPQDLWWPSPVAGAHLEAWILLRSISFYGLGGGLVALVLAGGLGAIGLRAPWIRRGRDAFLGGFLAAVVLFAYLATGLQTGRLAGLPWRSPERAEALLWPLACSALAGVVVAWVVSRCRVWLIGRTTHSAVLAAATLLVAGVATIPALGLRPPASSSPPDRPILVVGLDGATWRVLGPLLRQGRLPTLARLATEGAWGPLLTYGRAASPLVWTSIATGHRVREHGIEDFVVVDVGRYRPRPVRSTDWRRRPVWELWAERGRRVGVVNWLVTSPPKPVGGYLVSHLRPGRSGRSQPAGLDAEIEPLLSATKPEARPFRVAHHLLEREPLDLLALYTPRPDALQHRHWKHYRPEEFDPGAWAIDPEEVTRFQDRIPAVYERIDTELGRLLSRLPADSLTVVVSDHGQRAEDHPRQTVRLAPLLEALGFAHAAEGPGDPVEVAASRAYPLPQTHGSSRLQVNLNLEGREAQGRVAPGQASATAAELGRSLAQVELDDGRRLFGRIRVSSFGRRRPANLADLEIGHTEITRRGPGAARTVRVGSQHLPVTRVFTTDPTISGDHDYRGILIVHGGGASRGYLGQRVATTALQELLWRLTDRVEALDPWLPWLGRLGVLDQATTLDVTPSLLLAADLPIGRDMAGQPLDRLFPDRTASWVDTWEVPTSSPADPGAPTVDEAREAEEVEELRSLGYVN